MTEAFASTRQTSAAGTIHVAAPRIGDMLSGALHAAYDNQRDLPDEFASLLAKLDRVDRRPN